MTLNETIYREWAPNAKEAYLIGDFNSWDNHCHPMLSNQYGVWEISIPHVEGKCIIPHGSRVKISMILKDNSRVDRIPAWIRRATQDLRHNSTYDGIFWNPPEKYVFKHPSPPKPENPLIYEAHGLE